MARLEKHALEGEAGSGQLRLTHLLRDAAMLMRRRFIQQAREAGLALNVSEAGALSIIAERPGLHQAALSARLELEPIALVRLLDRLEQAGLVERRHDKADRRVRTIWPTPAALPLVAQIDLIRREVRETALQGVFDPARKKFIQTLLTIRANLG